MDEFEVGYDPLNYFSFANLYRAFKGDNPLLPGDEDGIPFIADLIDAINSSGLTFTPFVRKPLELAGVLNYRAWQQMFPQTAVVDVVSKEFLSDIFPEGLNLEEVFADALFIAIGKGPLASQMDAQRRNELVQLEMSAQAERGEPVDRKTAEDKVNRFIYLQTIYAFFSGAYLKQLDPAQLRLYNIQEALAEGELEFSDLTPEEQRAYRLFAKRKLNPVAFEAYRDALPYIESYYAMEDYDEAQKLKEEHPEIIPYTERMYRGGSLVAAEDLGIVRLPDDASDAARAKATARAQLAAEDWRRQMILQADTAAAMSVSKILDTQEIDYDTKKAVRDVFITERLKKYWAANDTPAETQDKMLQAEVFRHTRNLSQGYFAIPEKDKERRRAYLTENPILGHWFTINNTASDDVKDIINAANADAREVYFDHVEKGDWDGAGEFLKQFSFIFEFTSAQNRVHDGVFLPDELGTPRADAFIEAHEYLDYYADLREKRGKDVANRWLRSNAEGASLVRNYFAKYGKKTKKSKAYLKAKPYLDYYGRLKKQDKEKAYDWLDSGSEGARIVREFFEKYGDPKKNAEFKRAKPWLEHFDSLKSKEGEDAAREWLEGNSEGAKIVREFFDKYADPKTRKAFERAEPWLDRFREIKDKSGSDAAREWLNGPSEGAKIVREFFDKYAKDSPASKAFQKAEPHLKRFDEIKKAKGSDAAREWLNSDAEGAKLVRAFFDKYGDPKKREEFKKAEPWLDHFSKLKEKDKAAAYDWLNGKSEGAAIVRAFFKKYASGSKTEHAKAYLKMKPKLVWFHDKLPDEGRFRGYYSKWAWVFNSDDPAAKELAAYFRKWADKKGASAHARAYLANKKGLEHYFKLAEKDKAAAAGWLNGGSEMADEVLDYFKTYSKANQLARKWGKWIKSENPDVNRRLQFWVRYFELTPDRRPGFVAKHAEEYGVYIWGPVEDQAREEKMADYLRKAKKRHLTPKAASYLRVRPLVDLFHTLDDDEQKLLLKANPDLRDYFDRYSKGPATGDKQLDKDVEAYFKLDPDSSDRSNFLRKHPDVQRYFDLKNPADAAMHRLLEVYFAIPMGKERNIFRDEHPEISDYFDRKREERSALRGEMDVFDRANPDLADEFERAEPMGDEAEAIYNSLRARVAANLFGDEIETNRGGRRASARGRQPLR
jgi:hypothetical protein